MLPESFRYLHKLCAQCWKDENTGYKRIKAEDTMQRAYGFLCVEVIVSGGEWREEEEKRKEKEKKKRKA